jgi:hypothetical protein
MQLCSWVRQIVPYLLIQLVCHYLISYPVSYLVFMHIGYSWHFCCTLSFLSCLCGWILFLSFVWNYKYWVFIKLFGSYNYVSAPSFISIAFDAGQKVTYVAQCLSLLCLLSGFASNCNVLAVHNYSCWGHLWSSLIILMSLLFILEIHSLF